MPILAKRPLLGLWIVFSCLPPLAPGFLAEIVGRKFERGRPMFRAVCVLLSGDSQSDEARRHALDWRIIAQNKLCRRLAERNHLRWAGPRKQV